MRPLAGRSWRPGAAEEEGFGGPGGAVVGRRFRRGHHNRLDDPRGLPCRSCGGLRWQGPWPRGNRSCWCQRRDIAPERCRIAERADVRPGCGEGAGDVLVAGEHEHLPVGRLLRGELDQDAGRRTRPGVVEVDQGVVHHHRQADVVAAQVADQRQPQRQENLLSGAAAEPLRIPDLPVGVVNLEPGLVDGGGDRGIPPLGEPREPAGGLPQHRRLVVAGHGGAGLLEEHVRPMQQVSPLLLLGEPLLDTGQVHLQAFQGVVVGCGLHAGGDGLPPLRGRSEGGTVPERHVAGLGESPRQGYDLGLGQPAIDLRGLGGLSAGVGPGLLSDRGGRAGFLVFGTAVDLGQKLWLCGHSPADEELSHRPLGDADLPHHAAMSAPRRLQPPRELAAPPDRDPFGVEPLLEQLQVVDGRGLRHEFAFHEHLVDPAGEGREFLPLVTRFLREPPPVVIQREQRVTVGGYLPHLPRRERGRQAAVGEGLSPPAAGGRAGLEGPCNRLLGERDAVGKHVHRALAGEEFLEPFDLRLSLGESAIE